MLGNHDIVRNGYLVPAPASGHRAPKTLGIFYVRRATVGSCYVNEVTFGKHLGMAQLVKKPLAMQETWVRSLGQKEPLEKEMATLQ